MTHPVFLLFIIIELNFDDFLSDIVISRFGDVGDFSSRLRRQHDSVLVEQVVFETSSQNISSRNDTSNSEFLIGFEIPSLFDVQTRKLNSFRHENLLVFFRDGLERSLDSVENVGEDSWSQFY